MLKQVKKVGMIVLRGQAVETLLSRCKWLLTTHCAQCLHAGCLGSKPQQRPVAMSAESLQQHRTVRTFSEKKEVCWQKGKVWSPPGESPLEAQSAPN